MKKIFLILMIFLLIVGFCGCSKKKQQAAGQQNTTDIKAIEANDVNSTDPRLQRAREKTLSATPGERRPRDTRQ